jgi:hypothetical protein
LHVTKKYPVRPYRSSASAARSALIPPSSKVIAAFGAAAIAARCDSNSSGATL